MNSKMVVYNEIIALTVGIGLIGTVLFGRMILRNRMPDSEGWAAFFGITGAIMTVLGIATTTTWPYGGGGFEYANIQFGQPAVAFGLLSLFWAIYLWRHRELFANTTPAGMKLVREKVMRAMRPISLFVFASGLMMGALAISWLRYQLGSAPEVEPISGLFHAYPLFEATFLFALWGLVALGALAFPFVFRRRSSAGAAKLVFVSWLIAGVIFLGFGAMNFYTHIGMYTNINHGTHYKI